jgi:hypothetical protein
LPPDYLDVKTKRSFGNEGEAMKFSDFNDMVDTALRDYCGTMD